MRVKVIGTLIAIVGLIASVGAVSAMAAETSEEAGSEEQVMSPLSSAECPEHAVCVWSGSGFNGNFSWWPESDVGCHPHPGNPDLRSGWNNTTSFGVGFGGQYDKEPGEPWSTNGNPVTGEICWHF
jgi:hypothetical protein